MAAVTEFGAWISPITSALATESTVSFQELHVDRAQGQTGGISHWSNIAPWSPRDLNNKNSNERGER